ncbi:hypothetical protein ACHAXS_012210 [Conticribra weissflogii]
MDWSFPKPNLFSWVDKEWDLASAISSAASRGLFVHLRIGPYVCAEYSYGGIPEWLPLSYPHMNMRRPNNEWMESMSLYVNTTIKYISDYRLWAYQGGPIVIAQIENEIGGEVDPETEKLVGDMQFYADWAGKLAQDIAPNVIWTMCNGLTAPNCINTCNGYGEDGSCSTHWLEHHGQNKRVQIDQPALWTEDESGFQMWGDSPSKPRDYFWGRTARDFARDGVRWFARGGSHMFSGGYNRGRSAAAGIRNAYASDALLCPSGDRRHPKFDHLRTFHRLITESSEALSKSRSALSAPFPVEVASMRQIDDNPVWISGAKQRAFIYSGYEKKIQFIENDAQSAITVRVKDHRDSSIQFEMQPESAVVVVNGEVAFDSAAISEESQQFERKTSTAVELLDWRTWQEPIGRSKHSILSDGLREQTETLHQLGISSDYLWYCTNISVIDNVDNPQLKILVEKASAILVFVDREFVGAADNHEHDEGTIELLMPLDGVTANNTHELCILSESLGYYNLIGRWGAKTTAKTKGLLEVLLLDDVGSPVKNLSSGNWQLSSGFHDEWTSALIMNSSKDDMKPKWSVAHFATPRYDESSRRLFVKMTQGRGHMYINGYDLGRFWNISRNDNSNRRSQEYYYLPKDLLQEQDGMNELKVLDVFGSDLSSSVSIVISWIEVSESPSLVMEDIVDFGVACLI